MRVAGHVPVAHPLPVETDALRAAFARDAWQDAAVIPDQGAPAPVRPVQPSAANEPPRYGETDAEDEL